MKTNKLLLVVFCYNVQPMIEIDYATGDSRVVEPEKSVQKENSVENGETDFENERNLFVLNTNTKKVHLPNCKSVSTIKDKNRQDYEGTLKELKDRGYTPCMNCLSFYR